MSSHIRCNLIGDKELPILLRGWREFKCGSDAVVQQIEGLYFVSCWPISHQGFYACIGTLADLWDALIEANEWLSTHTVGDYIGNIRVCTERITRIE